MSFKYLNKPDNPKLEQLIQREFSMLEKYLDKLIWKSHTLASGLKEIQQRRLLDKQLNDIQKATYTSRK